MGHDRLAGCKMESGRGGNNNNSCSSSFGFHVIAGSQRTSGRLVCERAWPARPAVSDTRRLGRPLQLDRWRPGQAGNPLRAQEIALAGRSVAVTTAPIWAEWRQNRRARRMWIAREQRNLAGRSDPIGGFFVGSTCFSAIKCVCERALDARRPGKQRSLSLARSAHLDDRLAYKRTHGRSPRKGRQRCQQLRYNLPAGLHNGHWPGCLCFICARVRARTSSPGSSGNNNNNNR